MLTYTGPVVNQQQQQNPQWLQQPQPQQQQNQALDPYAPFLQCLNPALVQQHRDELNKSMSRMVDR